MKVLYCGDDRLDLAAKYLGAMLGSLGCRYTHHPSAGPKRSLPLKTRYDLYILSDFPSARLSAAEAREVVRRVADGAGLWMIGGWGSFAGFDGGYGSSPLSEALPVKVSRRDDRVQGGAAYRIQATAEGRKVLSGLNFGSAPGIAGFNRVQLKPGCREWLQVMTLKETASGSAASLSIVADDPLLVGGHYGRGRTLALMTDLAPHWCGGIVDWGRPGRYDAPAGGWIQVGAAYRAWIARMLHLCLKQEPGQK